MGRSLIGILRANRNPQDPFDKIPETGEDARILVREKEKDIIANIILDNVFPVLIREDGKEVPEFNGHMLATRGLDWTIAFTEDRMIFWSPLVFGPYGDVITQSGRAIGGHIKYSWISEMKLSNSEAINNLLIIASEDGVNETHITIEALDYTLSYIVGEIGRRTRILRKGEMHIDAITEDFEKMSSFNLGGSKGIVYLKFLGNKSKLVLSGAPTFNT